MILLNNQMVAANGVMNNETNLFNLKSKNVDSAKSTSGFSDIFNSTVNNSRKLSARNNQGNTQAKSNPNIKSFREAQSLKSNMVESDKNIQTQNAKPLAQISDEQKDDNSKSDNSNQMISVMAQMMGIKPEELIKIAESLGYSQQDLQNSENVQQFISQLSNILSLSDDQAAMLEQITTKALAVIDEKSEQSDAINDNSAPSRDADLVLKDTNELAELTKLGQQIKSKLNELIDLSEAAPRVIEGEINKVMEHLKSQAETRLTTSQVSLTAEKSNIDVNALDTAQMVDGANNSVSKDDTASTNEQKSDDKAENTEQAVKGEAATVKTQASPVEQKSDFNQHINSQVGKINADQNLSGTKSISSDKGSSQHIKPSEIVSQVINRAKVVVGLDKSEMVIDLKPDHLGKLSLKIVTEQGIIAAKFMAESQQVKEILESNMQLLKDSLQKQGISIEGVSVQVADRDKNSYDQQRSFEGSKSEKSNKSISQVSDSSIQKASGGLYVSSNILDVLPERLAQYSYESSSINMMA